MAFFAHGTKIFLGPRVKAEGDRMRKRDMINRDCPYLLVLFRALLLAGLLAAAPAAAPALAAVPAAGGEPAYQAALLARRDGRDEKAAALFQRAAEQGHPAATTELGLAYAEGRGVARDPAQAARWLNLAAGRGEPRALYLLGAATYDGDGVARDRTRATGYLGQAAVKGHRDAQYRLAQAFAAAQGVPEDPAWAARWYAKAARQGHPEALYAYGVILAAGRGLPEDKTAGYGWLLVAARGGHGEAARLAAAFAATLPAEQQAAAEARAAGFTPRRNRRFADPPTVTYLQVALGRLGHDPGPVDGRLGPQTRRALRAYQKRAGLRADGRLTPGLLERLFAEGKE